MPLTVTNTITTSCSVMGTEFSAADESFSLGLIEYPQFTRPQLWEGLAIPQVLTSGDHGKVESWRRAEAERLTRERRPDLWAVYQTQPLPTLPRARGSVGRGKGSPKR